MAKTPGYVILSSDNSNESERLKPVKLEKDPEAPNPTTSNKGIKPGERMKNTLPSGADVIDLVDDDDDEEPPKPRKNSTLEFKKALKFGENKGQTARASSNSSPLLGSSFDDVIPVPRKFMKTTKYINAGESIKRKNLDLIGASTSQVEPSTPAAKKQKTGAEPSSTGFSPLQNERPIKPKDFRVMTEMATKLSKDFEEMKDELRDLRVKQSKDLELLQRDIMQREDPSLNERLSVLEAGSNRAEHANKKLRDTLDKKLERVTVEMRDQIKALQLEKRGLDYSMTITDMKEETATLKEAVQGLQTGKLESDNSNQETFANIKQENAKLKQDLQDMQAKRLEFERKMQCIITETKKENAALKEEVKALQSKQLESTRTSQKLNSDFTRFEKDVRGALDDTEEKFVVFREALGAVKETISFLSKRIQENLGTVNTIAKFINTVFGKKGTNTQQKVVGVQASPALESATGGTQEREDADGSIAHMLKAQLSQGEEHGESADPKGKDPAAKSV